MQISTEALDFIVMNSNCCTPESAKRKSIKICKNSDKLEKKLQKDKDKPLNFTKIAKIYENNNLLIGDDKVEKSNIFTKYALYKLDKNR